MVVIVGGTIDEEASAGEDWEESSLAAFVLGADGLLVALAARWDVLLGFLEEGGGLFVLGKLYESCATLSSLLNLPCRLPILG